VEVLGLGALVLLPGELLELRIQGPCRGVVVNEAGREKVRKVGLLQGHMSLGDMTALLSSLPKLEDVFLDMVTSCLMHVMWRMSRVSQLQSRGSWQQRLAHVQA
jgi:hypothetical protein